jgi:putative zinc finger/helix-turn-helix YgiT family protein
LGVAAQWSRSSRCDSCEESFYTPDQALAAQRAAAAELRRQEDLLTPEEIRATRERFGLTQSQMERLLGVGPKTVVRWERGTVFQNRSTDQLLRVIGAVPDAFRFLAVASGVAAAKSEPRRNACEKVVQMSGWLKDQPLTSMKAESGALLPKIPIEALK